MGASAALTLLARIPAYHPPRLIGVIAGSDERALRVARAALGVGGV